MFIPQQPPAAVYHIIYIKIDVFKICRPYLRNSSEPANQLITLKKRKEKNPDAM